MRRSNLVVLTGIFVLVSALAPAMAAPRHLLTAFQPTEPASPSDVAPPAAAPVEEHVLPIAPIGCEPCIKYRTRHRHCKTCCGCEPAQNVVLAVENPRTGCIVAVPVCIPGCCTDAPCVDGRCAMFGRGIVKYEWCCGYKLAVTFKKHGDVLVTYHGK